MYVLRTSKDYNYSGFSLGPFSVVGNLHLWSLLNDILFFVKSLKKPNTSFNIHNYFTFSSNCMRSASHHKLVHKLARTNVTKNSYFYRLSRLWNALPTIDLNLSFMSIKHNLTQFFWNHYVNNFDPNYSCTLHFLCPCHKCVCTIGHSFK